MKLYNSYIFLPNPFRKENIHTAQEEGVIHIGLDKSVESYIKQKFPDIKEINESKNIFKTKYIDKMVMNNKNIDVMYIINKVSNTTYLDVFVDGNNKIDLIIALENINSLVLAEDIRNEYICIISYDSVSEYYCNKMFPKLDKFERNLRKLLFNIYIVNFGKDYYQSTISQELQNKAKSNMHLKGKSEKVQVEQIQQFFYSLDFGDIDKLLFTTSIATYNEKKFNDFLKCNKNLSKLSDDELRKAFNEFVPKSDWNRFFKDKIYIDDIENVINNIRKYRNCVAHAKLFNKNEYDTCNKLVKKLNIAIIKAIEITEEKDFTEKNSNTIGELMSHIISSMNKLGESLAEAITPNIFESINFKDLIFPSAIDFSKSIGLSDVLKPFEENDETVEEKRLPQNKK